MNVGVPVHDNRTKNDSVADRVTFDVSKAKEFSGKDHDFVAVFDCLYDMGEPIGAAAHVRQSLAKDGTWIIVEPFANDQLAARLGTRTLLAGRPICFRVIS